MPPIAQLLQLTGLVASLSEARRTVKEGGAYLNNERVTDADAVPGEDAWLAGGWLVLRRGKRAVAGVQRTRRAPDPAGPGFRAGVGDVPDGCPASPADRFDTAPSTP